jgi:transposase
MGHSRGDLTTKIHAMDLLIMLKLTEGQAADGRSAADMFDTIGKGNILRANRAYDHDTLRAEMDARGAWADTRAMPKRIRKPAFSHFPNKYRNLVERFFNGLKYFRAVATRYDKRDDNYLASVELASIRIWLRHNESVTLGCIGVG